MNGWIAFCLSWQMGQPIQIHFASGTYDRRLPVVGAVKAPLNFDESAMNYADAPAAAPMAAFLAQCR